MYGTPFWCYILYHFLSPLLLAAWLKSLNDRKLQANNERISSCSVFMSHLSHLSPLWSISSVSLSASSSSSSKVPRVRIKSEGSSTGDELPACKILSAAYQEHRPPQKGNFELVTMIKNWQDESDHDKMQYLLSPKCTVHTIKHFYTSLFHKVPVTQEVSFLS